MECFSMANKERFDQTSRNKVSDGFKKSEFFEIAEIKDFRESAKLCLRRSLHAKFGTYVIFII